MTQAAAFAPVAKAGMLVAITAALCRLASLLKEVFVAYVLGAGLATDAYALVLLIPSLSMALLVHALRSAFLTLYPRELAQGQVQGQSLANRFLRDLILVSSVIAAIVFTALWFSWPTLLRFAEPELVAASRQLLAPAAGLVVTTAAVAALSAVLNAYGRFSGPQGTAVIPTATVIVALLVWRSTGGAWVLVGGLLAGTSLQVVLLMGMLLRAGHVLRVPKATAPVTSTRAMWRMALPVIAVSILSQLNVYVDRSMASSLESGAVAVLAWSGMLRDLVAGTLIGAFVSVLLPHFATLRARGSASEISGSCNLIIRAAGVLLFPLTAMFVVCLPLAGPDLAFGQFRAHDATLLAACVAAYSAGFFADMVSNALFQGLLALGRLRVLLWLSLLASFIPNIVFNLLLIRPLGAPGLALSTSLVGYLTLLANYLVLRRSAAFKNEREMWLSVARSLAFAALAGLAAFAAGRFVRHWVADVAFGGLIAAIVAAAICIAGYLFLALVFPGSRDAQRVLTSIRYMLPFRRRR